jgi:hypothetical protein
MALNKKFYLGATKQDIAEAMNPFKYLIPATNKDEQHREVSVSREEFQADVGKQHRPQYQDESDSKSQVNEWSIPSPRRVCHDSI